MSFFSALIINKQLLAYYLLNQDCNSEKNHLIKSGGQKRQFPPS